MSPVPCINQMLLARTVDPCILVAGCPAPDSPGLFYSRGTQYATANPDIMDIAERNVIQDTMLLEENSCYAGAEATGRAKAILSVALRSEPARDTGIARGIDEGGAP